MGKRKRKDYTGKDETCWFDGVTPQGLTPDGGGVWPRVSSTHGPPHFSRWKTKRPGLELKNRSGALHESDSDEETPTVPLNDYLPDFFSDRVREEDSAPRLQIQHTDTEAEEGTTK